MATSPIARLKDIDRACKPSSFDDESGLLLRLYQDEAQTDIQSRLQQMHLGVKGNPRPLVVNLLRRTIDRLAVIYSRSPSRWLRRKKQRLEESSPEHEDMVDALSRAQYDLAWRLADRTRALLSQAVLRLYPSDDRKSVVVRIFAPHLVLREVDPSVPDMDSDRQFALRLTGRIWEHWTKLQNGQWDVRWRDNESGKEVPGCPFEPTDFISPYSLLPVQQIWDDFSGGRHWLPLKASRISFFETISMMANDLWNLLVHESHTQLYFSTDDPSKVPDEHGPGIVGTLPADTSVQTVAMAPKVAENKEILNNFVRLFLYGESLPLSELDESKQVLTGAALRAESRPLVDRREAQVPLARDDERRLYARFVSVHNLHAESWDVPKLSEDTEMDVEIAPMDVPVDERDILDADSRALALGARSTIDLISRLHNVPRHQAVQVYRRIARDNADFPPLLQKQDSAEKPAEPALKPGDGRANAQRPRMPDPVVGGSDSMLDALHA